LPSLSISSFYKYAYESLTKSQVGQIILTLTMPRLHHYLSNQAFLVLLLFSSIASAAVVEHVLHVFTLIPLSLPFLIT